MHVFLVMITNLVTNFRTYIIQKHTKFANFAVLYIFSVFDNILQPNFAVFLILICSF